MVSRSKTQATSSQGSVAQNVTKSIANRIIMNWTSVRDRFPPDYEEVLFVCNDFGINKDEMVMVKGFRNPTYKVWEYNNVTGNVPDQVVTHWMPLPELPK